MPIPGASLIPKSPASAVPASAARTAPLVLLWPQGAPGAVGKDAEDRPALYLYPVPRAKAKAGRAGKAGRDSSGGKAPDGFEAGLGPAAVVCPGGAYGLLALEKEGHQVAEWLNSLGVSAFVLRYRLGPRYRHPAPAADLKRALRWVRAHASEYRLDPLRIGVVGFSAGGHLAATVATRYDGGRATPDDEVDAFPCQPAFQVLIYPVITMEEGFGHRASRRNLLGPAPDPALVALLSNERHVTAAAPPAFLVHARPDPIVPVRNSEAYAEACRKAGVPVELHLFDTGTHAFGLGREPGPGGRPEPAEWTALCARWLGARGFLPAPEPGRKP
jgi:acetyl esterase/lipase